eukprot:15464393-Alexandrium_andersonii.AAC.1
MLRVSSLFLPLPSLAPAAKAVAAGPAGGGLAAAAGIEVAAKVPPIVDRCGGGARVCGTWSGVVAVRGL